MSIFPVRFLCVVCVWSSVSLASTVDSVPLDAQAITEDGTTWTVDVAAETLNASRYSFLDLERRPIMEFPLDGIPAGATILSATFHYQIALLGHPPTPIFEFHGYVGDGVLTPEDAVRPIQALMGSAGVTDLVVMETAFDKEYVQSILGTASHLGVLVYMGPVNAGASFYATEFPDWAGVQEPMLTIEYEAAPAPNVLIPVVDRRDHLYDATRGLLYITTSSGTIERYDVAGNRLLAPWPVGDSLNGFDITADGTALYVAEDVPASADRGIFRSVSLPDGRVTAITFPLMDHETGTWDIGLGPDNLGLISTNRSGSGWVPFRDLDISAGDRVTIRSDTPGSGYSNYVRQRTRINRSADRSLFLMQEGTISTAEQVFTWDAEADQFPTSAWLDMLVTSPPLGAVSPDGSLIAIETYDEVFLMDRDLNWQAMRCDLKGGLIFDPNGPILYAGSYDTNEIVVFHTRAMSEVNRFDIGEDIDESRDFDTGVMSMTDDSQYLFISTPSGVRRIEIPPLPDGPFVTGIASRRQHGVGIGPHELPLYFGCGSAHMEPRQNGDMPQMVFKFSEEVTAADGEVTCGQEIVVDAGQCQSVSLASDELVVDMTFDQNARVTVSLHGLVGASSGSALIGDTVAAVVTLEGDVNGDNEVDVRDLQAVKDAVFTPVDDESFLLDVNADGQLNVLDLQATKDNIFVVW